MKQSTLFSSWQPPSKKKKPDHSNPPLNKNYRLINSKKPTRTLSKGSAFRSTGSTLKNNNVIDRKNKGASNNGKTKEDIDKRLLECVKDPDLFSDDEFLKVALQVEDKENGVNDKSNEFAKGFNDTNGDTWVYPINLPVRDYQFEICEKALFKNTMVILPTGLGKTFIAAVVMFNYHRWFPCGKIVFLAPTKPLVSQQINACTEIMGLSTTQTVELTGAMSPKRREQLWTEKMLLFLTPQTMMNDLSRKAVDAKSIRLLMIDEAHKARGNYAYCQVVNEILQTHTQFRIVALTATPGNDLKSVQEVVTNLKISHVEVRSEQQLSQFCHERSVQAHVVELKGPIVEVRHDFLHKVLLPLVGKLRHSGVLWNKNPEYLSRFEILTAWNKYKEKQGSSDQQRNICQTMQQHFNIGVIAFFAWELLNNQGLRSMYCYLREIILGDKSPLAKTWFLQNQDFMNVFSKLKTRFEGHLLHKLDASFMLATQKTPNDCSFLDNSLTEDYHSHPKLEKLEEIVLQHFNTTSNPSDTRVIIFSTYRESVHEITEMLLRHKPLIKVMNFVGQGNQSSLNAAATGANTNNVENIEDGNSNCGTESVKDSLTVVGNVKAGNGKGLKQAHQRKVIEKFKSGHFNVLVSTCVGEEGLDIGEVDMIVNFDNPKSLIRLIQRAGRTGRKRQGTVHAILTAGKEEMTYKSSLASENKMTKVVDLILGGKVELFRNNPNVIPPHCEPKPLKMYLSQPQYEKQTSDTNSAKNCFKVKSKTKSASSMVKSKAKDKEGNKVRFEDLNVKNEVNGATSLDVRTTDRIQISKNTKTKQGKDILNSSTNSNICEYEMALSFFPLSPKIKLEFEKFCCDVDENEDDCNRVDLFSDGVIDEMVSVAQKSLILDRDDTDGPIGKNRRIQSSSDRLSWHCELFKDIDFDNESLDDIEIIECNVEEESSKTPPLSPAIDSRRLQTTNESNVNVKVRSSDNISTECVKSITSTSKKPCSVNCSKIPDFLENIRNNWSKLQVPLFQRSKHKNFDLNFKFCFSQSTPSCNSVRATSPVAGGRMLGDYSRSNELSNVNSILFSSSKTPNSINIPKKVAIVTPIMAEVSNTKCHSEQKSPLLFDSSVVNKKSNRFKNCKFNFLNRSSISNSSNQFHSALKDSSRLVRRINSNKSRSSSVRKEAREFLASEADVSEDANSESDDDDDDDDDEWTTQDRQFLASQPVHDHSQMKYIYMRSVRPKSPNVSASNLRQFLRKPQHKFNKSDIFSQPNFHEQSSYIKDSFIVSEDEECNLCVLENSSGDERSNSDSFILNDSSSSSDKDAATNSNRCSFGKKKIAKTKGEKSIEYSRTDRTRPKKRRRIIAASQLDASSSDE